MVHAKPSQDQWPPFALALQQGARCPCTGSGGAAGGVPHFNLCVRVCVSHPGSKGFPRSHLSTTTEAGSIFPLMQGATESLHGCRQRSSMQLTRISRLITVTYLQPKPLTTLSNLLGLFPFPPPKPFPPQQRCSLSRFVTAVKGNNHCSNTYNFSDFSPYCSTAFLPNVAIESN